MTASEEEAIGQSNRLVLLDNPYLRLVITPELGGRILGFAFNGHEFFWHDPSLSGPERRKQDASGEGWPNWGGEKLWPAPQGWDGPHQWPGPPDKVIDEGRYACEQVSKSEEDVSVSLVGIPDLNTGIMFTREIRLLRDAPRVRILASMRNVTQRTIRWSIWTVAQLNAHRNGTHNWNDAMTTYVPINQKSVHAKGYRWYFNTEESLDVRVNLSFKLLSMHFDWRVGKVGLDSNGGWTATVDGYSGNVFIQLFSFDPLAEYPDQCSVAIWSNGLGTLEAYGAHLQMPNDHNENPFLKEVELMGPLKTLLPGEEASFEYSWLATNVGGDFPITAVNAVGCTAKPLEAVTEGDELSVTGRFGVFTEGYAGIELCDDSLRPIFLSNKVCAVSPSHPLIIDHWTFRLTPDVKIVRLLLWSDMSPQRGCLAEVQLR